MAFTEGSNDGALNGVTEVTLVAAPAAATRRLVRSITVQNRDTVGTALRLYLLSTADERNLWSGVLEPGDTLFFGEVVVLDTVDKSVRAVLGAAATTTNPDFTASWGDAT